MLQLVWYKLMGDDAYDWSIGDDDDTTCVVQIDWSIT